MELKNQGMTNSAMFNSIYGFDIERCFDSRADFINKAKAKMRYMYDNNATKEQIDSYAINMAEEFKTIIETALRYRQ